ncbi:MAG: hypothetical protein V9G98_19135 [Candidatus Competibacter sp.]
MNAWQLTGLLVLVGVAAIVLLVAWVTTYFSRIQRQRREERMAVAERAAAERAAAERAAAKRAAAERAAAKRAAAAERAAAKRAAMEAAAAEQVAVEKAILEQAIAEWAAAGQAESERAQSRRVKEERLEAERVEARMQAVEDAIAEWLEAEQEGSRLLAVTTPAEIPRKKYTRTEAIHQQVRLTAEQVEKEVEDLDFIKNRIEAGVDFLPIEFKLTIDQWKKGQILKSSTFSDLKLKFRYKAYSIEDGYELLYRYTDWLAQQRQKLRVFIRLLGTEVDNTESIQAAIERAEQRERQKYLEMDVDAIFTLRDVHAILERLIDMENSLKQLEVVCRKRSEQIITPSWEAKGSL